MLNASNSPEIPICCAAQQILLNADVILFLLRLAGLIMRHRNACPEATSALLLKYCNGKANYVP
jgi:hypothetical protein